MNIYHITHGPDAKELGLHFWGCNMSCRGCLCQEKIYDCHLEETKDAIFVERKKPVEKPARFLDFNHVLGILKSLDFSQVIFMGMEATLDPELPMLAEALHREFQTYNILLTNGLRLIPMEHIDEVVVSIKAYQDELHRDYTGVSNKEIFGNFAKLHSYGKKLRTESVLIPDYIACSEIQRIAEFIAEVDRAIPYRIDAYFPTGSNPWRRATPDEVKEVVGVAGKHLLNVSCLKGDEKLKYKVVRIY